MHGGVAYMLAAAASFTLMAAAAKIASAEVSPWLVVHVRSLLIVVGLLALMRARRRPVRFVDRRTLVARSAYGFAAMVCYFWALSAGPLADVVALQYTSPLFVAGLSPLWVGEAVGRRTWLQLAVGFAGALILLRPGGSLEWALVVALASAFFSALAYLSLRRLRHTDDPDNIVLFFACFASVASCPAWLTVEQVPGLRTLAALVAVGVFAGGGQMWVTRAYGAGRAAVVSGVGYVAVPMGAVMGVAAFAEPLTPWAIAGGLLVVGAGLGLATTR